jgi:hypothetical protein
MRRILLGAIEHPLFGQIVLSAALTFSRLIFGFRGILRTSCLWFILATLPILNPGAGFLPHAGNWRFVPIGFPGPALFVGHLHWFRGAVAILASRVAAGT